MLKDSKINALRNGLNREIELYKRVLEISLKEQSMLVNKDPLTSILAVLPEKLELMKQVEALDASLKELKEEWVEMQGRGEDLPVTILPLLKDLESLIHQVIELDEKNQCMLKNYAQGTDVASRPRTIESNAQLRARHAYGQNDS